MATNNEIKAMYKKLRPYFNNAVSVDDLLALDDGVDGGEPQLALGWLIAYMAVDGIHIDVPRELFFEAYALLSDDDKIEYDSIFQQMETTNQLIS